MIKASYNDKSLVIDILTNSFDANQSVNYIVQQGSKRIEHIKYLMEYSFEICFMFGDVFLSDDRRACALVLYPEKKKSNIKAILLDIKLILNSVGISNISKALSRESKIKKAYPKDVPMYYLWFIGVYPSEQNKGIGTQLLQSLLSDSKGKNREVFLETSTIKNLPWYKNLGFSVYNELDFGYKLYFLKSEILS